MGKASSSPTATARSKRDRSSWQAKEPVSKRKKSRLSIGNERGLLLSVLTFRQGDFLKKLFVFFQRTFLVVDLVLQLFRGTNRFCSILLFIIVYFFVHRNKQQEQGVSCSLIIM